MSEGFNKWSNNPNTDPNILAIRWGEQKPILETELNEMQDLAFQQKLNENITAGKHSTYSATNCYMETTFFQEMAKNQPDLAQYFDLDTSSNSQDKLLIVAINIRMIDTTKPASITFNFGGGLTYTYNPTTLNTYIYMQLLPMYRAVPYNSGEIPIPDVYSVILPAKLKHYSPDSTDDNYDSSVNFAYDTRAGRTTTQRVVIESGFNDEILLTNEDLETVISRLDAQRIISFNDEILLTNEEKVVECLLATWIPVYTNTDHFLMTDVLPRYEIQQVSKYIPTKALKALPDFDNVVGKYTATPISVGSTNTTWELHIELAFKSRWAGYMNLQGTNVLQPINRPFTFAMPSSQSINGLSINLYNLEDIIDTNKCYETQPFNNISWDALIHQDWFYTSMTDIPNVARTFRLKPEKVSNIGSIECGRLVIS